MILLIMLIIGFIILEYIVIKDILKLLRIISSITISSGYIILLIGYLTKIIINNKFNYINISKITNIIVSKNTDRGLIFILIGSLELIGYILTNIYKL